MKIKSKILCTAVSILIISSSSIQAFASNLNGSELRQPSIIAETKNSNELSKEDAKLLKEMFNIDPEKADFSREIVLASCSQVNKSRTSLMSVSPGTSYTWQVKFKLGTGYILAIVCNGINRSFVMSTHAMERVTVRFGGSMDRVARVLVYGDLYDDLQYGGYVSVYGTDAVCWSSQQLWVGGNAGIKTIEDGVTLGYKLANGIWGYLSNTVNLF